MRVRVLVILVFGAAAALWHLGRPPEVYFPHADIAPGTVKVLAARQALLAGARLSRDRLVWIDWPKATLPAGVFTRAEELFGAGGDRVWALRRAVGAGKPLLVGALVVPPCPGGGPEQGGGDRQARIVASAAGTAAPEH